MPPDALQQAVADPEGARPADILTLQRRFGNQAVQRLLAGRAVQAKLTVGPAGDAYEQEADQVAERVMKMPALQPANPQPMVQRAAEEEEEVQTKPLAASITPLVQRAAAEEEEEVQTKPLVQRQAEEEEEEVQAKRQDPRAGFEAGREVEDQLHAQKGNGCPLPPEVRADMEPRFGTDFSGVRVHTGGEASRLNRQLSAQAFTHGQDIYVGEGKYNPGSDEGQRLLAHELTHVVQQTGTAQRKRMPRASLKAGAGRRVRRTAPRIQRIVDVELTKMEGTRGRFLKGRTDKVIKLLQAYNAHMHSGQRATEQQEKQLSTAHALLIAMIRDRQSRKGEAALFQLGTMEEVANRLAGELMAIKQYRQIIGGKKLGSGQVNTVWMILFGEGWQAVWKADEPQLGSAAGTAIESGISKTRANMANRNIAMYRLDQLLLTGVIPQTERAQWGSEAGTVMEMVKGKPLRKVYMEGSVQVAEDALDVNLAHPEIQRGLSNLQFLDAIAGQVDRHGGNVFVERDNHGNIVGIKGIDNDFAFGKEVDATGEHVISHDRGLPKFIDLATALRIEQVSAKDVRKALEGLLSGEEIEKTVQRFMHAKNYCTTLLDYARSGARGAGEAEGTMPGGRLVSEWGAETYRAQVGEAKQTAVARGGQEDWDERGGSYLYSRSKDQELARERVAAGSKAYKLVPLFQR